MQMQKSLKGPRSAVDLVEEVPRKINKPKSSYYSLDKGIGRVSRKVIEAIGPRALRKLLGRRRTK